MGPMPKTITRLGLSRRWFIAAGGTTLLGARRRLASAQGRNFEVKWVGASRDVVRGDLTPRNLARIPHAHEPSVRGWPA